MKQLTLLTITLLLLTNHTQAQSSKKAAIDQHEQISQLKHADIANGKYLNLAHPFTRKQFVEYYIANTNEIDNKKYSKLVISEVYKDSGFTYFVREVKNRNDVTDFFKVAAKDLQGIRYEQMNGNAIRDSFFKTIVPAADKAMAERKSKNCTTTYFNSDYTYLYIPETDQVEISFKWKISCDFISRIIRKTYTARYDLATLRLIK